MTQLLLASSKPIFEIAEALDEGKDLARDLWFAAKLGALAGYTYLMIKAPVQTARFTFWAVYYYSLRTAVTMIGFMGELHQQIRLAHGKLRTRPPPGPLSPFILLGIPAIISVNAALDFLGSDSSSLGGCQESVFTPGQCQVV